MHAHWNSEDDLQLYLANGVTGIRIMWGFPINHEWKRSIENGTLQGPRLVIASPIIDGTNPVFPTSLSVANAAEARQAVVDSKAGGAEFIKIYDRLSREAFFAIADEARKQRIPFAGHVPSSVSAAEASDAGMKSIEHLSGVLEASSMNEAEVRIAAQTVSAQARLRMVQLIKDGFSSQKEAELIKRFHRNRTWQTPTLVLLKAQEVPEFPALTDDPRLRYIPRAQVESWGRLKDRADGRSAQLKEYMRWAYTQQLEAVALMNRAGVGLLAGSDSTNPYCLTGFGLHDELALLVLAGLTPAEALRTATINPALFLERDKELGSISSGKIADLVLLDANPLVDIRNTTRISAVVANGKLLDRITLDKLLSHVEAAAGKQ